MEKLLDSYKGVVLFYIIIAVFTLLCTVRINTLNNISNSNSKDNVSYYAFKK